MTLLVFCSCLQSTRFYSWDRSTLDIHVLSLDVTQSRNELCPELFDTRTQLVSFTDASCMSRFDNPATSEPSRVQLESTVDEITKLIELDGCPPLKVLCRTLLDNSILVLETTIVFNGSDHRKHAQLRNLNEKQFIRFNQVNIPMPMNEKI